MIELTDELEAQILDCVRWTLDGQQIDLEAVSKLFEIIQSKQVANGASVVEWVDFDPDDEATWPKEEKLLLAPDPHNNLGQCTRIYECGSDWLKFHWCGSGRNLPYQKPFKWAYIPIPKEK